MERGLPKPVNGCWCYNCHCQKVGLPKTSLQLYIDMDCPAPDPEQVPPEWEKRRKEKEEEQKRIEEEDGYLYSAISNLFL